MDNIAGQKNIVNTFKELINSQTTYAIIIFILPLIGLISSNIYTSSNSDIWYSNIRFVLPDISHGSYGLYISTFFYLIAGAALVLIYKYYNEGFIADIDSKRQKLFLYAFYLIPVLFLLIYISNPITYQSQSLLASGILYIFATILSLCILYLTFYINNYAKWLWLIFVIWLLYTTIFYFSYYSADGRSAFLMFNTNRCDDLPPPPLLNSPKQNINIVNNVEIEEENIKINN
ncbi:unknown similar to AMEV164 [Adoxophyes honmai entomopoxvirus 'L']|uniref:Uncharacterized protein n=1 Tax=Adoxophyes honmai entomopoxvirus 'L' TaxID=1293540 RepID=A0A916KP66_9POXV|nr:unknown similar to AMEV164 [Adoxophyes honmai entomopoxvirus 'L']CCU55491.1 unknown similar to AMEV164 [Adoxophyes honmai entomopoxvirus 'L']